MHACITNLIWAIYRDFKITWILSDRDYMLISDTVFLHLNGCIAHLCLTGIIRAVEDISDLTDPICSSRYSFSSFRMVVEKTSLNCSEDCTCCTWVSLFPDCEHFARKTRVLWKLKSNWGLKLNVKFENKQAMVTFLSSCFLNCNVKSSMKLEFDGILFWNSEGLDW